jgi:hypothetical protein
MEFVFSGISRQDADTLQRIVYERDRIYPDWKSQEKRLSVLPEDQRPVVWVHCATLEELAVAVLAKPSFMRVEFSCSEEVPQITQ